jgi:hypothetical protein
LVIFQVYYLPLIGYFSGLLLAIGWLFLQVYYLPLIGYFSGLLLAIGWLFLQVYYLPLIGYFSGLLLAIDWLFFRFITCHWLVILVINLKNNQSMASKKPVKITNQWQVINLKNNQSMASNKPVKITNHFLPLICYFSCLLLAIDLLCFRFISCH